MMCFTEQKNRILTYNNVQYNIGTNSSKYVSCLTQNDDDLQTIINNWINNAYNNNLLIDDPCRS